jgi:hypothetical protein
MSAGARTGGSTEDQTTDHGAPRKGTSGRIWLVLLALVFVLALGGSYVLVRGRAGSAQQSAPIPTATTIATPVAVSTTPTAAPVAATPASSSVSGQPTLTADQAQAAYLWQQSHEQDFCSCNTANPPSSP